jgi:hypothetical protein
MKIFLKGFERESLLENEDTLNKKNCEVLKMAKKLYFQFDARR